MQKITKDFLDTIKNIVYNTIDNYNKDILPLNKEKYCIKNIYITEYYSVTLLYIGQYNNINLYIGDSSLYKEEKRFGIFKRYISILQDFEIKCMYIDLSNAYTKYIQRKNIKELI